MTMGASSSDDQAVSTDFDGITCETKVCYQQDNEKAQCKAAGQMLKSCSWQQAAFNLFFAMFAAAQVPFALSQMGWYWGTFIFAMLAISSWWSGHVLTDCCVWNKTFSWRDLAERAFGKPGGLAIESLQTLSFVLTGIVQTQGSGSQWQQAFPDVPLCASSWILLNALPYVLFLQIPSFGGSGPMKLATAFTLLVTLWRVGLYMVLLIIWGRYHYVCYGGQTATTVMSAASNLIFTFGVKNLMPEMTREMEKPEEMHKAWRWANAFAMPMYALVGFLGFWAFGIFNSGANFFLNFRDTTATRAYLIFAATAGYLPIIFGQICLFLKIELRLGVLPTDWIKISNPDTNKFPCLPPVLFRFLFRTGVAAFYVFVAEALLGVGLQNMLSLVGALAVSAFSFYLPWLIYMKLYWQDMKVGRRAIFVFWTLFGIFFAVLGTYFSVVSMTQMDSSGLFDAPCRENAFFLGRFKVQGLSGDAAGNGGYSSAVGNNTFHDTFYRSSCLEGGSIDCSQYGACCEVHGDRITCSK